VKLKTKMVFYIIVLFKNQIIYYQKNVYFKIDDKPDDIEKQNVTTKERIDDILKYEKETETNIEN